MWLVLHPVPPSKPDYYNVTLSGVEILKVNRTNGNLAGPNLIPAPKQDVIDPTRARASSDGGKTKNQKAIIIRCVGVGIVLALILGFFLIAASRRQHGKDLSARVVPSRWHKEHQGGFTKNHCHNVTTSRLLRSALLLRNSMRFSSLGLEVLVKFTREKLTMEQAK